MSTQPQPPARYLTPAEVPQAIEHDYPGWEVRPAAWQWTATCPAITVHAPTVAGLRAAIEHAICGDDE